MFIEYIDFRINLAIGLIILLVFLLYFIEIDWMENRSHEECDDAEDTGKRYRWY